MKTNPTQSNSKISNWVSNLDMKDHPLAKLIASIKIIRKTNCYDPQERDRTKKSNKTIQKQHQCGKTKEVEENYRENQKKVAWKIEGRKGEKLNFEVCLTRLLFIKVVTSVTHVSIYSLGH